jgi:biotin synthase-related radical SAM superfamily protein
MEWKVSLYQDCLGYRGDVQQIPIQVIDSLQKKDQTKSSQRDFHLKRDSTISISMYQKHIEHQVDVQHLKQFDVPLYQKTWYIECDVRLQQKYFKGFFTS